MALATAAPIDTEYDIHQNRPISLFMNCSASQPANSANDNGCDPTTCGSFMARPLKWPQGNLSNIAA